MRDPGLDRHEWETEWQQLEDEPETAPAEALPEVADLVERMLQERGMDVSDPVVREGDERSFVAEYIAGRELADRVERGEDVDPGDVGAAVQALRELYEFVLNERRSP